MTNELWPSTMIFAAHNVIIAAGLLWYVVALGAARANSNHTNLNESFEESKSQQQYGLNKPEINSKKVSSTSNYVIFFTLTSLAVLSIVLIAINLSPSIISIWSEGQEPNILVSSENRVGTHENSETGN